MTLSYSGAVTHTHKYTHLSIHHHHHPFVYLRPDLISCSTVPVRWEGEVLGLQTGPHMVYCGDNGSLSEHRDISVGQKKGQTDHDEYIQAGGKQKSPKRS